jgi:hypothetical protein
LELIEAREILEAIERSRHQALVRSFEECAVRYAERQTKWPMAEPSTRLATNGLREIDHDVFVDSCEALSREMGRSGEANDWCQRIPADRNEIRDFACLLHCILGMRAKPHPRGKVSSPSVARTTCELHGEALLEGTVKITYGLVLMPNEYREAEEVAFPWASAFTAGGCVLYENRPDYEPVRYCESCREGERAWRREHPAAHFEGTAWVTLG